MLGHDQNLHPLSACTYLEVARGVVRRQQAERAPEAGKQDCRITPRYLFARRRHQDQCALSLHADPEACFLEIAAVPRAAARAPVPAGGAPGCTFSRCAPSAGRTRRPLAQRCWCVAGPVGAHDIGLRLHPQRAEAVDVAPRRDPCSGFCVLLSALAGVPGLWQHQAARGNC